MAQTNSAFASVGAAIEYATDGGTTWNDMAGTTVRVVPSGGERMTGERFTLDGDTGIITIGKRATFSVALTLLDENATSGTYADFLAYYESGGLFRVRWSPAGGTTGDLQNTSDANYSYITAFPYGAADAEEAAAQAVEVTMVMATITQAAVA